MKYPLPMSIGNTLDEMFGDLDSEFGAKDKRLIRYLIMLDSEYDVRDYVDRYAKVKKIYIIPPTRPEKT